jgi:hypothetical protein
LAPVFIVVVAELSIDFILISIPHSLETQLCRALYIMTTKKYISISPVNILFFSHNGKEDKQTEKVKGSPSDIILLLVACQTEYVTGKKYVLLSHTPDRCSEMCCLLQGQP